MTYKIIVPFLFIIIFFTSNSWADSNWGTLIWDQDNWYLVDSDSDGLSDGDELQIYGTDPYLADSDGDGLNDGTEVTFWGEKWNDDPDGDLLVNLLDPDSDNDGLSDGVEVNIYGTSPDLADTDGDGYSDFIEINSSTDPLDNSSFPFPGDANSDKSVTLEDSILILQILSGIDTAGEINPGADVNGDKKISIEEVIFTLQVVSLIRPESNVNGGVNIIGTEETVFDWTTDQCEAEDIPDLPARAFRDNSGKVQLIATHARNRRMIGDDLDSLVKDCNVIMDSHHDPDPAMYNDSEWINATYTLDGETVYALIHNEYQGSAHPGHCPSGSYINCWYNSITMAVSLDSGQTYTHASAPDHLVASVPYQYVPDAGPYGIFEGSNILYNADEGYYYKMLHLEDYGLQKRGACVIRTQNLADPSSWRAWDGSAFSVRFINPYTETGYNPADHVCEPVSFDNIDKMADNITFNTFFNKFMLVGTANVWDPEREEEVFGFFYSLSDDLVNWSARKLIMERELWWTNDNSVDRFGYPALIDPTDDSRNYSNTGRRPYLYYTRWNNNTALDRDLLRIQIEFY